MSNSKTTQNLERISDVESEWMAELDSQPVKWILNLILIRIDRGMVPIPPRVESEYDDELPQFVYALSWAIKHGLIKKVS